MKPPGKGRPRTKGNAKTGALQRATLEDNMNTLFDAIGLLIDNPVFCEWMHKFCEDCPRITRIPATRYTPAEEFCPCDFQPFVHGGCERENEIYAIEAAAEKLDELMKGAAAL